MTAPAISPATSAYDRLPEPMQRFVDEYLAGEKPTTIARQLRPKAKTPSQTAWKWLRRPDVQAAIDERKGQLLEEVGISQAMIVRELGRIAFGDPRKLYDESGQLRPMHELDDDAAAMVAGVETVERIEILGKGKREKRLKTIVNKLRRWDKRQALVDLAQYAGIKAVPDQAPDRLGPGLTVIVQNGTVVEGQRVLQGTRITVGPGKR
jgi:phage terminase small subunit